MVDFKYDKALGLAKEQVSKLADTVNDSFEILTADTVTIDDGWIFFYDTVDFIREGKFGSRLVGNCPVFVMKDMSVHLLPTHMPLENAIEEILLSQKSR